MVLRQDPYHGKDNQDIVNAEPCIERGESGSKSESDYSDGDEAEDTTDSLDRQMTVPYRRIAKGQG